MAACGIFRVRYCCRCHQNSMASIQGDVQYLKQDKIGVYVSLLHSALSMQTDTACVHIYITYIYILVVCPFTEVQAWQLQTICLGGHRFDFGMISALGIPPYSIHLRMHRKIAFPYGFCNLPLATPKPNGSNHRILG